MTVELIISIAGSIISVLLIIISYFVIRIIDKVDNTYKLLVDNQLAQTKTNSDFEIQLNDLTKSIDNLQNEIKSINENIKSKFSNHIKEFHNEK